MTETRPRRLAAFIGGIGLLCLAGGLVTPPAHAGAGDASSETMKHVFPEATGFGAAEGDPPAVPAYKEGRVVGYVFRTHDVVRSVGMSGKTLNIAVGLDLSGLITGAEIVEHHEPILAIGVSSEDLEHFVSGFRGRDASEPVQVLRSARSAGELQAVSGATVSSLLIADAIYQAARAVGRSRGILSTAPSGIDLTGFEDAGWDRLVGDGSVGELRVTAAAAGQSLADRGGRLYPEGVEPGDPDSLFIGLTAALATPARIGRNLLGAKVYNRLAGELADGDHLIFVAANGRYSFKGTAYVRTGSFDRIQLVQDDRTYRFAVDDHIRVERLAAQGAPGFREAALFRLRQSSGFDASRPWRLELILSGYAEAGTVHSILTLTYDLPARYRPAAEASLFPASGLLWQGVWMDRVFDVAVLLVALLVLGGVFFLQDLVARRRRFYRILRYCFLTFTLVWIGWYAVAQLTVLNVLTFAGALRTEFRWEFFLLEPLIFILWAFVAVALLFGGRGAFCGWLCPFGALQELLNRIGQRFQIRQFRVPFALHERLWPIKYIIFLGLFAVSLGSIDMAQAGAEVEPFKTAIVLRFMREWPFLLYVAALLGTGLFIERAFCRYLCPLGAALAIPARIRMFEWLKRRWHCGRQCNICATKCPVQAIHPNGSINPNECIYCLNCQTNYFDDAICPPLIERRKRRELRAGAKPPEAATDGA